MRSNCILYAFALSRRRRAAHERRYPVKAERPRRYIQWRWSDWGPFPHCLYGEARRSGLIRLVSYKPVDPRKRPLPPPLFHGEATWGDRKKR